MGALATDDIILFENFRLDRRGLFRRDDHNVFVPVAIGSRALEVLGVLVERPGEVISRDEIIARVWPATVVEDSNLNMQVAALRRALDDRCVEGSCIKTVSGRGYRFVAPVTRGGAETSRRHRPPATLTSPLARELTARRDAERRQLTVLICDAIDAGCGFSQPDPEDLRGAVEAYRQIVAEISKRYEARFGAYPGNRAAIYFGWPTAHENDAERAVRAALALKEAAGRLALAAFEGVRVGIATGSVIVSDTDADGRPVADVIGASTIRAARLVSMSEPGAIMVDAATRRLTGSLFEYGDIPTMGTDDDREPAARVLRESGVESRYEALRGMVHPPMIGRDEELDLLLRRWHRCLTGNGQVVLVSGEPGIGKSRIIAALEEHLHAEPHVRLRYFCSPYHQDSALSPVIDQLNRASGSTRDDSPAARLKKLEALLARAAASDEDAALLAELLSLPGADQRPLSNLTPQRKKERTLEALLRQLEGLARQTPVLMIVEDAHWIDPTSRELIDLTVERIRSLPVLVVVAFRPEFQPSWAGEPQVSTLTLNRLDRRDRIALATQTASGKALPDEILVQIADRSDGVPLFVEELTKSVLERGLLREEEGRYVVDGALPALALPTTLQASLLARLDRLAASRQVAPIAAAIGHEFSFALLDHVAGIDSEALREGVNGLVRSELVFSRGEPPHAVYTFKHALVRDAAYDTLLRGQRQELHARTAAAFERHFPDDVEEQPEIVAQHCTLAGLNAKAIGYWTRAGRKSLVRSAMVEAAAQFEKGLELLYGLPDTPVRRREELDLQSALGRALVDSKGPAAPETGRAFDRGRTLCEQLGEMAPLVPIMMGQFAHHLLRGELRTARRIAHDLLRLGEEKGDPVARLAGHQAMASCLHDMGEFAAAMTHCERVLTLWEPEIGRTITSVAGYDPQTIAFSVSALDLFVTGCPDQALSRIAEAVSMSRGLNNYFGQCLALQIDARLKLYLRCDQGALASLNELIATATEQRILHFLRNANIELRLFPGATGDAAEGIAAARRAIADMATHGVNHDQVYFLWLLARACERAGETKDAFDSLAGALEMVDRTGARWFEAELHRLRGEWLITHCGRAREAAACFERSAGVARQQDARMWELRAAMSLARLWRDQGRRAEAHLLLAPIHDRFTEGSQTPDLQDARALLDELA